MYPQIPEKYNTSYN